MLRERVVAIGRARPKLQRPWLLAVGATIGFLAMVALELRPPDPESRLPASYRLAALIERQQQETAAQRQEVAKLRAEIEARRNALFGGRAGAAERTDELTQAAILAGTAPLEGVGFTVVLDDSTLEEAPTGNVNDLVIHSQDVQAVVNAMWASGAEAVAINGERVVGTSAILCVGNTLLLNGTVHSPPYRISGIGADRAQFRDDVLVKRVESDAERFSLRFSIGREEMLRVPGYSGATEPRYAEPVTG